MTQLTNMITPNTTTRSSANDGVVATILGCRESSVRTSAVVGRPRQGPGGPGLG